MYFGQGQDFKLTTELSEKVQYSRNQATKNSLNEDQDLTLCEGDSIFNSQPVKISHFKSPLTRKQAR